MYFKIISSIILFVCTLTNLWGNSTFERANEAYHHEQYQEALALYKESLNEGQSYQQHFNLGNTYNKLKDYGQAILHYNKALVLSPSNDIVEANLVLTQQAAGISPNTPHLLGQLASLADVQQWVWTLIASFWTIVFMILLPRLFKKTPIGACQLMMTLGIIGAVGSTLALFHYHNQKDLAIILTQEAPLKVAPSESSPNAAYLNSGTMVKREKVFKDFTFLESSDKREGWVHQNDYGAIWD